MRTAIVAFAKNTYKEGVRDRIFLMVGVFGVIAVISSFIIGPLSLGEQVRITQDVGLAAISILCFAVAVLIGTGIVYREIERRTIYTIVAKPVRGWHFILGKFLGLNAIVGLLVVFMAALLLGVNAVVTRTFEPEILVAVLLTWFELLLLTSLSILMSTICSPILGAILTFLFYFIGHASADLKELATRFGSPMIKAVATIIYYALPNLEYLNVRSKVIHDIPVSLSYIGFAASYALLYTIAFLMVAVIFISRKEYK